MPSERSNRKRPERLTDRSVETFAQADHRVTREPKALVETHGGLVRFTHEHVDLQAFELAQASLGMFHHLSRDTFAAMSGIHCQVVDPAPVSLVTGHDRRNDSSINDCYEEESCLELGFAVDVLFWIVLWYYEIASSPQVDNLRLVVNIIRSNHQVHSAPRTTLGNTLFRKRKTAANAAM